MGEHEARALAGARRFASADDAGNDMARLLCEHLAPRLVLCGHMHAPFRGAVVVSSGQQRGLSVPVACLANVEAGERAVALFERREDRTIVEVG